MAGDWIRVRVNLDRDPKVIVIGDRLRADPEFRAWVGCDCVSRRVAVAATVAALVRVWGIAREEGRQEGDSLVIEHGDLSLLDALADTPGIGAAMASVGWAQAREGGGVVIPNFFRQNASTENRDRKRAADRERMRGKREAERQAKNAAPPAATVAKVSHATPATRGEVEESKSTKEEIPPPPPLPGGVPAPTDPEKKTRRKQPGDEWDGTLPAALDTPAFRTIWERWEQHRRQKRDPLRGEMRRTMLAKLAAWGEARAAAAIEHTIFMGWTGLREPDPPREQAGPRRKTAAELFPSLIGKPTNERKEASNGVGGLVPMVP